MSRTLTDQDIRAIGKEMQSVMENCLKKISQMETTSANDLLNVDELAETLKLSKQSIYKIIKEDQIKSIKIGKNFYVKKSDLNSYVNSKY